MAPREGPSRQLGELSIVCVDGTQRISAIIPRGSGAEVLGMEPRKLGPRSARWAALRPAIGGSDATSALPLTGWGATHTTWTPHGTTHAVHAEHVDRCLAVCGALLVVIDLTRRWTGEHTAEADACRRCTELLD
jgi:hypothetical protein